jgi:hypothetical protein
MALGGGSACAAVCHNASGGSVAGPSLGRWTCVTVRRRGAGQEASASKGIRREPDRLDRSAAAHARDGYLGAPARLPRWGQRPLLGALQQKTARPVYIGLGSKDVLSTMAAGAGWARPSVSEVAELFCARGANPSRRQSSKRSAYPRSRTPSKSQKMFGAGLTTITPCRRSSGQSSIGRLWVEDCRSPCFVRTTGLGGFLPFIAARLGDKIAPISAIRGSAGEAPRQVAAARL